MAKNSQDFPFTEFKKELKDLLDKYECGICFSVGEGSDTHGLWDEELRVYPKRYKAGEYLEYILAEGWSVDGWDLK